MIHPLIQVEFSLFIASLYLRTRKTHEKASAKHVGVGGGVWGLQEQ